MIEQGKSKKPDDKTPSTSEKALSAQARRAIAEAAERQKQQVKIKRPKEIGGSSRPEPTRYGDWEKGGIVYDF